MKHNLIVDIIYLTISQACFTMFYRLTFNIKTFYKRGKIVAKNIFIINPVAGKGRGLKLIPLINNIFKNNKEDYVIEVTNKPGHAEMLAAYYARMDKCRIYSVGGDGTLNEVMNGMAGTDSELAIIPCGTGNDFIRSIVDKWSLEDILVRTINGSPKTVDFAKVNSRYFINIASVGFDAEVVFNTQKFKNIPGVSGSLAYILGIIYTVFKYSGDNLKVYIDGKKIEKKLLLTTVANGRFYGGGMQPAPQADICDGLLDISLIIPINIFKILAFFPRMIKGTHVSMEEVSLFTGRKVEIECDKDISINADGEIFKGRKVTFELQKGGISVVMPSEDDAALELSEKSS